MQKFGDLIASLILIFVGIWVTVKSVGMDVGTISEPKPGFFPFSGGVILTVLSMVLLFQAWRGRSVGTKAFGNLRRPAIIVTALLVYILFFEILGFVAVTVMLSVSVLYVLKTKWWVVIGFSLILAIGTYILFDRVLVVPLPSGILARLL